MLYQAGLYFMIIFSKLFSDGWYKRYKIWKMTDIKINDLLI